MIDAVLQVLSGATAPATGVPHALSFESNRDPHPTGPSPGPHPQGEQMSTETDTKVVAEVRENFG
ncbi:MAG TPA: hypothetical protein VEP72_03260, partial [Microbacterium sp.]|nr:hypothetical protein [Microbacterium sp.]